MSSKQSCGGSVSSKRVSAFFIAFKILYSRYVFALLAEDLATFADFFNVIGVEQPVDEISFSTSMIKSSLERSKLNYHSLYSTGIDHLSVKNTYNYSLFVQLNKH